MGSWASSLANSSAPRYLAWESAAEWEYGTRDPGVDEARALAGATRATARAPTARQAG